MAPHITPLPPPDREITDGDAMTGLGNPVSGTTPLRATSLFAVVVFTSIALYNVVELSCIILTTFKKRSGLYFVSFCVATWGIPPYSIGFLILGIHQPEGRAIYGYVTMIIVGWVCTVTGQSVVLYSRLHLIDRDSRHLRWVLAMIITNGVVLHSVTAVMTFGANSLEDPARFYEPYSIVEKVQVTVFFVQELIISLLYIYSTVNFFRNSALHTESTRARMLWHLVIVNILVICLDITILGLEYADLYKLQTAYKAMAYSVKLKLEFSILNGLVKLARDRPSITSSSGGGDYVFDGTRPPDAPSRTRNTVSGGTLQGGSRSDGSRKRGSFQAVAEYFACARRAAREEVPPVQEGVIVRRTDTSVVHHDASETPMGSAGGAEA